jgi:hypothetical protein
LARAVLVLVVEGLEWAALRRLLEVLLVLRTTTTTTTVLSAVSINNLKAEAWVEDLATTITTITTPRCLRLRLLRLGLQRRARIRSVVVVLMVLVRLVLEALRAPVLETPARRRPRLLSGRRRRRLRLAEVLGRLEVVVVVEDLDR